VAVNLGSEVLQRASKGRLRQGASDRRWCRRERSSDPGL